MKKVLLSILLSALLALSGCGGAEGAEEAELSLACTTYPVYLLANTIAGGLDGVEITLVIDQEVSCLHDYTLTMRDMQAVERADAVICNGAGLEEFLSDALADAEVIDCSAGVDLLYGGHHHHDGEEPGHDHAHEEADPHIWMHPAHYAQMARTLAGALAELDPERSETYLARGEDCAAELEDFYQSLREGEAAQALAGASIITFHDGFSYFAEAFDLTIAAAIEEEEGAEASARDLKETIALVEQFDLPAVFTEVNGSDNAAGIICRECGTGMAELSMLMSGAPGADISAYEAVIAQNLNTIREAYQS